MNHAPRRTTPQPAGDRPSRPAGPTAPQVATALAAAGGALVVVTSAVGGSGPAIVPFVLWGLAPWALLWVAGRGAKDPWIPGGAGAAGLAIELGVRAAVFVFPAGSTAAIALIFSPVIVILALVVGGVAGWILGRLWARGGLAVKAVVVVVPAVVLGLTVLGLARPDLFPTTVASRRAEQERIGPPRVVTGGKAFEKVLVSERPSWVSAADLDGAPGDEIAVIGHRAAELFDSRSLERSGSLEFSWSDRTPLTWFSALVRLDGRVVLLQTGGGFSDTELLDLEGRRLWRYQPDPKLPPTALRAADLDLDGETELYAAHSRAIVRLDGAGRELWSRPARLPSLVGLAPRSGQSRAWVVALDQGWRLRAWDESGTPVGELQLAVEQGVQGVVDWPRERALILSGDSGRGIGLDGATRFELPLEGLRLVWAGTVRFAPDAPPDLALLTAARRDVERWRLRILSPEQETVYEEILDRRVRLRTARAADGSEVLLLSGGGVRALRPRRSQAPTG